MQTPCHSFLTIVDAVLPATLVLPLRVVLNGKCGSEFEILYLAGLKRCSLTLVDYNHFYFHLIYPPRYPLEMGRVLLKVHSVYQLATFPTHVLPVSLQFCRLLFLVIVGTSLVLEHSNFNSCRYLLRQCR